MRLLLATLSAFAALASPAAASCALTSVQGMYDRSPSAVVATVVEQRPASVVLDVERTLKGEVALGRQEMPNPQTSVRLSAPAGSRVGLAIFPDDRGGLGVNDCGVAAPGPFALAAGPRAGYVVAGGRTLLVLSRRGRELRRFTVSRRVRAVARGPMAGVVAHRTATGVRLLDVVGGTPFPGDTGTFRPSRALRLDGRVLRRDGRRVATLPPGRLDERHGHPLSSRGPARSRGSRGAYPPRRCRPRPPARRTPAPRATSPSPARSIASCCSTRAAWTRASCSSGSRTSTPRRSSR